MISDPRGSIRFLSDLTHRKRLLMTNSVVDENDQWFSNQCLSNLLVKFSRKFQGILLCRNFFLQFWKYKKTHLICHKGGYIYHTWNKTWEGTNFWIIYPFALKGALEIFCWSKLKIWELDNIVKSRIYSENYTCKYESTVKQCWIDGEIIAVCFQK